MSVEESTGWTGEVSVIGLGYIGLPTSAALAAAGVRVHGVDVNAANVATINAGRTPIVERDLDAAVERAVASGRLTASTDVESAQAFLIAVPTPFLEDHRPDLSYVRAATESIAPRLTPGCVVILESTSPPGTTMRISQWLADLRPDLKLPHENQEPDVHVAHCPERVLPGRIMVELVDNDRVVGGITPACAEKAASLYRTFCRGEIMLTDATTAEMAKLTENSFRDVNIAFANELANICDRLGVDVWETISLANHHPRVNILQPGPGVGGHCIAVDPWFLVDAARDEANLIRTARETNDARPRRVVTQVASLLEATPTVASPVIACLGLAFKPNIDDLRESPAVEVVAELAAALPHARILAVEPHVAALPAALAGRTIALVDAETAIAAADVVVLLVDHAAFEPLRPLIGDKPLVNTRGVWRR